MMPTDSTSHQESRLCPGSGPGVVGSGVGGENAEETSQHSGQRVSPPAYHTGFLPEHFQPQTEITEDHHGMPQEVFPPSGHQTL